MTVPISLQRRLFWAIFSWGGRRNVSAAWGESGCQKVSRLLSFFFLLHLFFPSSSVVFLSRLSLLSAFSALTKTKWRKEDGEPSP